MELTNRIVELHAENEQDKIRLEEFKARIEDEIEGGKMGRFDPTPAKWVDEDKTILRVYNRLRLELGEDSEISVLSKMMPVPSERDSLRR